MQQWWQKIMAPNAEYFIGILSGTSMDSIDCAIFTFNNSIEFIAGFSLELPSNIQTELRQLATGNHCSIDQCASLDITLGKLFAKAITNLLKDNKIKATDIKAIGCHGQTIRHQPQKAYTIQLASPNIIAAELNIPVVYNFRQGDLAQGGQGAPLAPALHRKFFQHETEIRTIVNIGGISNITILPPKTTPQATILGFDAGPGNCLLDAWCRKYFNCNFDNTGKIAASGKFMPQLLKILTADNYFTLQPPKSTGSEYFNLAWLESKLQQQYKPEDVLTTLTELSATCIAMNTNTYAKGSNIYLCGGGAYNNFLQERIAALSNSYVTTTKELGVPVKWVETALFAWLAKQRFAKQQIDLTTITGAEKPAILGAICC